MSYLESLRPPLLPALIAAALWLAVLPALAELALRRAGLVRPNYRGDRIPAAYGLLILLWAAPVLLAVLLLRPAAVRETAAYLAVVAGFGGLGLMDDLFGNRRATGLRGHLRQLIRERELTTGLVKAAGGLAIGTVVARSILGGSWPDAILDGVLIALSANLVNLLDLRPGRAGAFFLICAAVLLASSHHPLTASLPLAVVLIPAALVYLRDRRGVVMMGDTGSNLLGGVLGLTYVLTFPGLTARLVLLAALLLLHLVAERCSFTAIIERSRILRWLDSLTGVR